MTRKGQIGFLPLIGAGVTVIMASISGFFYQSNRIGVVETRASVLEVRYEDFDKKLERIEGKYEDFDKKLERIEGKLDTILSEKYQRNSSITIVTSTKHGN